jgi:hypothetical protein
MIKVVFVNIVFVGISQSVVGLQFKKSAQQKCQADFFLVTSIYLLFLLNRSIASAQVHQGKQVEQTVVVAVFVWLEFRVPELVDKVAAVAQRLCQRQGGNCAYKADRVAQSFVTTGFSNVLNWCAV